MAAVEVSASGSIIIRAVNPAVTYGRLRMSLPIAGQLKKWSSTKYVAKCVSA